MFVGICEATFRAEWVSSLKEKRMVVKSLVEKTRHKFNASVAEVDRQEEHKMLVVGFACVSNEKKPCGAYAAAYSGFHGEKHRSGIDFGRI